MKFVNIQLLPLRNKKNNKVMDARKYYEKMILKDDKKEIKIYGYKDKRIVYAVTPTSGRIGNIDDVDVLIARETYRYKDGEALFTTISYSDVVIAHRFIAREIRYSKMLSRQVDLIEKYHSQLFY